MNYNIIEKARREICVLFSFCAVERHDTDPSKPGQSAEKASCHRSGDPVGPTLADVPTVRAG